MTVIDFNKAYAANHHIVLSYVQKRVNDYQLAEDITSNVFMLLWEDAPKFESEKHIGVWIIKTACHRVIDTFRSGRWQSRSGVWIEDIEIPDSTDVDQYIANRDTLAHIFTIKKNLPPRQKELFELSFMQELPSKKIARILKTADQSVRNQLSTLRKKIRANISRK